MWKLKKMKIKKITMSAFHVISFVQSDAYYWPWGGKPRNLYITSGNLQVLFLQGGIPKAQQMAGGKGHLTLFLYVDMHTKTQASMDKRSSYATQRGYRYDGIYRIEKCWQAAGRQVNRYDKYFDDIV